MPTWCDEHGRGGVPAYWLIVNDWLVLPLQPTNRPTGDVFLAVTCLYRGMREDEERRPQQALLVAEKLRLHREELLRLMAGQPLPRRRVTTRECQASSRCRDPHVWIRDHSTAGALAPMHGT